MTLGEVLAYNVKMRRELRAMLQKELAIKIGVTEDTIKRIEAGEGTRLINIERLADFFEVEACILLTKPKETHE